MQPLWFSEIEPFPSAVLAHHWPAVPNLGDMCLIPDLLRAGKIEVPDILVGGTPCQAFSVAGLRKGLDDDRGQLTLKFVEIANEMPRATILWENVPGVLSSKDNAFGCFLGALAGEDHELQPAGKKWTNAGCVFGPKRTIAWRVLDAQHFGVAQRRRRVFVVACPRGGASPQQILFESEGVRRDSAPCRETLKAVAALTANGVGTCGADDNQAQAGHLVTHRMTAFGMYRSDGMAFGSKDSGNDATVELSPTLRAGGFSSSHADGGVPPAITGPAVRRLTPVECERLQGFPDNHTLVEFKGKPAADAPRYRAIGNSKAVPVVRWIGRRLCVSS